MGIMRRSSLLLIAPLLTCLLVGPALAANGMEGLGPLFDIMKDKQINEIERQYRGEKDLSASQRAKMRAILHQGALDIRQHLDKPENKEFLAREGGTAVYMMAIAGFEEIVEVLLTYPEVRARLNEPTIHRTNIWAMTSLAVMQSGEICGNQGLFKDKNAQLLAAYIGTDPATSPFPGIRQKLEAAGATPKPAEARTLWAKLCMSDPYNSTSDEKTAAARRRIADAPDTLTAILAEMAAR